MKIDYQLEVDSLAITLTKPATRFGVPFIPFFTSMVACMLGWMVFQMVGGLSGLLSAFIFLVVWVGIYAFMLLKSSKDIFGLAIFFVNLMHFRKHKTHAFWGNTDSYLP